MILIVDDDQAIRLSLGLMLTQGGFDREAVSNEPDALAAVRRDNIELVILDLNLTCSTTGRQGIELLRKIKILRPLVPVILITAWGTIPLAVDGMGFGAVDFITKPWNNRDFMAKIRKAISHYREAIEKDRPRPLDDIEREAIVKAIRQYDGKLSSVAEALGITRQSLYRRLEKYGIKI